MNVLLSLDRGRGPWTHRVLVCCFSLLFAVLVYWLLGFVVRDIATLRGPVYADLEQQMLAPELLQEAKGLRDQIASAKQAIAEQQQRQTVLRDSTGNSERTMNQLLEIQRMKLQQNTPLTAAESTALGESEQLFLENQRRYQQINEQVSALSEQLRDLENRDRAVQKSLEGARRPVGEEYQRQQSRHQLKIAALKLAFLIPLLAAAVWLFLKKRASAYALLIHGFGLAVLIKVGMVMHEHFPRRYFKYVLIGVALALVARILVQLLRMVAHPRLDWLLKQYREAYEHHLCPICGYPIRRGPLKYLFWNRRSLKKLRLPPTDVAAAEELYVCPACGTRLYEECPACRGVRHALLPVCARCGVPKEVGAPGAPAS
jgi:hypothetical protein